MSTPTSSRPAASVSPTRQQLDDLEALMQRMLALPVHPLEAASQTPSSSEPPAASPEVPAEPTEPVALAPPQAPPSETRSPFSESLPEFPELPPPPPVYSTSVAERLAEVDTETPVPVDPLPAPLPEIRIATVVVAPQRPTWLPPLGSRGKSSDSFTQDVTAEEPSSEAECEPVRAIPVPPLLPHWQREEAAVWLRPLIRCNTAFDGMLGGLGPLGRWLQTRRGRTVLGSLGLVMLAAAALLGVLDWLGWTW